MKWTKQLVDYTERPNTVYIRKPDRPAFEWSSLGHFLGPAIEWLDWTVLYIYNGLGLDHLKVGHKSPGFEWSKPRPLYYKENISYDPL
jgi:hypothetical protein